MTARYAYFHCPNCKANIRPPYSTPEEPTECLPRLPRETWSLLFLCLECDALSVVTARDVRLNPPQTGVRSRWVEFPHFFRVDTRCVFQGCGFLRPVFVYSPTYTTKQTAVDKIRGAFPRPPCPNPSSDIRPHSLSAAFDVGAIADSLTGHVVLW